ncbi:conserved hypothetical protein [Dehalogenimonas lykanthroporepellens BL-DC-9]|nr:conserved hypothetical protein [Dehalogenimonas lykanthroporepellens BL-DC-9]
MTEKIAEIIETTSTGFTAQCYELNAPPALGTLVRTAVDGVTVYGVVAHAATTSLEPGRSPVARGRDETDEDAVFAANPHLEKLMRCEIQAVIAGHKTADGAVRHCLPPRPARLHGFVYDCDADETREFVRHPGFIPLLLSAEGPVPAEELTAATLRALGNAFEAEERRAFLVESGQTLARLLAADYNRLRTILERLGA